MSVPPGFTITAECCKQFCGNAWNGKIPSTLWDEIIKSVETIEEDMDSKFGDPENPLLVSVRSGAAVSMPGMMDTVLNLGELNSCIKIKTVFASMHQFSDINLIRIHRNER